MSAVLVIVALLVAAPSADAASSMTGGAFVLASPLSAGLQRVIDTVPSKWRFPQGETYRWDQFPSILVVETASFSVQDRLFSRLAYFLEKKGFRGQLLTDARLSGRHGWNAHDYGAAGLAEFFTATRSASFPINPEETALRELVVREGIIVPQRGGYAPGRGGVLGISRSSSRVERELLLTHEAFHGLFFSSAKYRDFCQALWGSLSPELRSFYERFLDLLGYDITSPTLVVNEFQAYLMQQPVSYAPSYFKRFLRLEARPAAEAPVELSELSRNAENLDSFCRERFGFGAGGPLLAGLAMAPRSPGRHMTGAPAVPWKESP